MVRGNQRAKDPALSDFHNDMNEHGAAEYRKATGDTVAELDSCPGGWWLTLWRAVKHPANERYAPPEIEGNRYAWDAVARKEYDDRAEAEADLKDLRGKPAVEAFTEANPYEGPLRPYVERVSDAPTS